jgi:hypothetical protein
MNMIPVFFENVDRSAMIIIPKKPFHEWLISIEADNLDTESWKESTVYLLPDFELEEDMEKWLKKNFDQIFCDQMNNWYTDEVCWISKRTYKLFKEWFDFSLHTMIMDTLEDPIEKF